MIFRPGPLNTISLDFEEIKRGRPAIVVAAEGRVPHRGFRRLLLLDAAIIEEREGELWILTPGEVEGRKAD